MNIDVKKCGKDYKVEFNQGGQYFTLDFRGDKEECEWAKRMLKKAFDNMVFQAFEERRKQINISFTPVKIGCG